MTSPESGLESLKDLLLAIARERSTETVLDTIVRRLVERQDVALARIWLLRPGDICGRCSMRDECPQRVPCLHLVASAGESRNESAADWSRLDGRFSRIPVGVRKVGYTASNAVPVIVPNIPDDSRWIADPEWAEREGIIAFHGQPLVHRGEVLGVLGVFLRTGIPAEGSLWMTVLGDHAAAAIANARAFEEIERLRRRLEDENEYLREEVREAASFGEIVGESASLRRLVEQIDLVAPTDASVLILGESGTGKELVAREIHHRSRRADRPLIKVNCASIPKDLFESEFFGHVRGSFTGALRDRAGRFELANGGTLFLDEVGEIPIELQGKLLRVLQEGTFERVGDERTRSVDVRVVAATNRDLREEVASGRFRQDLFYRLNVFPIEVPPLRERPEDIPVLAEHFARLAARKFNCEGPRLTAAGILRLQEFSWPGNVRELQNVIERAVITTRGGTLRFDLPSDAPGTPNPSNVAQRADSSPPQIVTEAEMRRRERDNIRAALERTGWKVYGEGGAAELLGVRPTTLASRIKKLGIEREPSA